MAYNSPLLEYFAVATYGVHLDARGGWAEQEAPELAEGVGQNQVRAICVLEQIKGIVAENTP